MESARGESGEGTSPVPVDRGSPIGRRIVLGMLGAGALGIAYGGKIQSGINQLLAPLTENDPTGLTSLIPTGGGFRFYSITGSEPSRSDSEYRLSVSGLVNHRITY